jgi:hypothetical protein
VVIGTLFNVISTTNICCLGVPNMHGR